MAGMATANWWKDWRFGVAMLAACLYWAVLLLVEGRQPDWAWPLRAPRVALYAALLYPVAEELVFRGLLQELAARHLRAWRLGPLTHANVYTSLLFTGLHFINHPPLWAAAVFVPSLIFGYFRDRTGGVGAPIVLHVWYNTGYFWLFTTA
ncbi:MAG TPA: JDVT-CTERM system CAAX-type protease [Gammaproteobacteria bacterium]|nr:JDVT-CTERM system CAAX-type protease [Gammaproteobacteria bacterium]